jgi:hypothetical protein
LKILLTKFLVEPDSPILDFERAVAALLNRRGGVVPVNPQLVAGVQFPHREPRRRVARRGPELPIPQQYRGQRYSGAG